ncbi:MAG: hypothetical protein ACXVMI_15515 [Flavisolibacter sp.]
MNKFRSAACFGLSLLIVLSSCSKSGARVNNTLQDTVTNNSFEVRVLRRESKWAVISWKNLQSLSPSETVKYKIYINGALRKLGLTATVDTITNISFDTTYPGYVYAYTSTRQLDGSDFNLDRLPFERELLAGLWNAKLPYGSAYKQRYFGADSSYFQDASNFNHGVSAGKWWWGPEDSVRMLITTGFFANPTPSALTVFRLTKDSLKIRWGTEIQTYYK